MRPISSSARSVRPHPQAQADSRRLGRLAWSLTIVIATLGQPVEAQTRYTTAQFDSARFRHIAHSEIQTTIAGRERRERVAVVGLLVVHASPGAGDTIRLEAWYDSLEVRRSSSGGTLTPDTDGMIGGRFRGRLASGGVYVADARPFVPDGVAEVIDLSRVLEEFFPILAGRSLRAGQRWSGPEGLEIRRLSDSLAPDTLLRFRAIRTRTSDSVTAAGDSAAIPARQTTREEEQFAWHQRRGLVRRSRTIVVETSIPGGGTVGRPVRSRVEQHIVVERLPR